MSNLSWTVSRGENGLAGLAVKGIITSFIIGAAMLVLYRLRFHPLAKYPGPLLGRTTNFYSVYHAYRGDRHLDFHRCHQKYGPVFRYSPNGLSFNTASALETIHSAKANCQKSRLYEVYPPIPKAWSLVNAIPKAIHARKKRVMSQAFSDRAVKDMEEYILTHVRKFTSILRSDQASAVGLDMSLHFDDLVMDIFSELCFGKSYGLQGSNNDRSTRALINQAAQHHYVMGQIPYLDRTPFDRILIPGLTEGTRKFRAFSRASAMARAKSATHASGPSERKDIFSHLLSAKDAETGEGLPQTELWGEAGTLIAASSDTSSTCLAATLYYLSRPENRSCCDRLLDELKAAFPGEDIEQIRSGAQLNSCTYLRACIDEALRISPPVPGLLPREVLSGGMVIDGQHIPAGTDIGVPLYALHHNEEYFTLPSSYQPERWLTPPGAATRDDDKQRLERQQAAFAPFLIGPRGCIGKNMAYMEMLIVIARIVWAFDFKDVNSQLADEAECNREFWMRDQFTADKEGPFLTFNTLTW